MKHTFYLRTAGELHIWSRILELIISREMNKLTLLPQGKQPSACTANDTVQVFMGKAEFLEICILRCGFAVFPGLKGCYGKMCHISVYVISLFSLDNEIGQGLEPKISTWGREGSCCWLGEREPWCRILHVWGEPLTRKTSPSPTAWKKDPQVCQLPGDKNFMI